MHAVYEDRRNGHLKEVFFLTSKNEKLTLTKKLMKQYKKCLHGEEVNNMDIKALIPERYGFEEEKVLKYHTQVCGACQMCMTLPLRHGEGDYASFPAKYACAMQDDEVDSYLKLSHMQAHEVLLRKHQYRY